MEKLFYEFLLYFYIDYIKEDWDIFTKFGKICIYPAWFIRSVLMWIISPIFIVPFLIQRTSTFIKYKEIFNNIKNID
jgi:hypothetical protein